MRVLVNIDVPDVEQAVRFYGAALNLAVKRNYPGFIEIGSSEMTIQLLQKSPDTPASHSSNEIRRYERHWCPIHLDFVVDDIDAALARCLKAGATLEQPVAIANWGKLALLADPFGHGFCLIQFLGRGYDELISGHAAAGDT